MSTYSLSTGPAVDNYYIWKLSASVSIQCVVIIMSALLDIPYGAKF